MTVRRGRRQAGFTLIELMVALVISSILIGLVLSIYTRMSLAYRTQQQVSELQQVLQAAQSMVMLDVRQAGYQIPKGFKLPGAPPIIQPAIQITNSATGPDEIRIFYADASKQARVTQDGLNEIQSTVDAADDFKAGDIVLLVRSLSPVDNPAGTPRSDGKIVDADGQVMADIAYTSACVLQVASAAGTTITYSEAAPWGVASNTHCDGDNLLNSMVYLLRSRAYRVDPTRKALSVLQVSPSGGLVADDWEDLGIGFTDLQIATRWFDLVTTPLGPQTLDTADIDNDPRREWYSGAYQQQLSAQYTTDADLPATVALIEVTVSFALRTSRPVEGVATGATPAFIDPARVNNGQVGDRPSITLSGVLDADRDEEHRGNHIYRYTTARIDVRNMGVGL